ncbi:tRNA (N6-threonylcarbamoyladenosine(37)-N6)-methyltransferase TrmO [Infirmifilum lucidum]|uniref:tRNA (N6-threonylcarbamoyladenosine(37)-N6)-methyltransferase TrmO n=1 Tax=Infirmifilum lucidum TaxID=2776706 RepID=A0A7L9FLJ2_9CREN|nr:tRNA (N6-threonylcarbamoyladenosine(37)-N6)-methyltransferase TrmO [Infirmifilum lucidum]
MQLKPIGVVHTRATPEEVRSSLRGVDGVIEVFEEYAEGLVGLEGFSHVIVIAYLHLSRQAPLLVKPRRLARFGIPLEDLPAIGVFATDSPDRPNPLALSIVELKSVRGRFLEVSGLDLFDGTPVLDIKPYTPSRSLRITKLPAWYTELVQKLRERGIDIGDV